MEFRRVLFRSGKWICFLNAGDVFADDESLDKVSAFIDKNNSVDVFYGNILVDNSQEGFNERIASEPCNKHRMFFCHQAAFVKTGLMKKYPFDEKYKMSADFKFFKKLFLNKFKFCHMNFPVAIYDTCGISNTVRKAGLLENIAVIKETDKGFEKIKFLARLYFVVFMLKVRKKK